MGRAAGSPSTTPGTPATFPRDWRYQIPKTGVAVNNTGNTGNGTLTIDGCSILQNSAGSNEGGLYANSKGTVKITNSIVSGNTTTVNVGGLYINIASGGTGDILLKNVTVSGNTSDVHKGGAGFDTDRPGGKTTLINCTITGNTAAGSGGGLYFNKGTVLIDKSTIAGNTAAAGMGGGVKVDEGGSLTVTKSSILNNSAAAGGGSQLCMADRLSSRAAPFSATAPPTRREPAAERFT
jgi:hypothetical protein